MYMENLAVKDCARSYAATRARSTHFLFLDMLFNPLDQQVGELVAVGVPDHDVVVAPDPRLRDPIEERALGKLGQREISGVAAGRCRVWRRVHKNETFPVLEMRAMNGGTLLATSRLIRGSAVTKAAAISVPWSCVEVRTKASHSCRDNCCSFSDSVTDSV